MASGRILSSVRANTFAMPCGPKPGDFVEDFERNVRCAFTGEAVTSLSQVRRRIAMLSSPSDALPVERKAAILETLLDLDVTGRLAENVLMPRFEDGRDVYGALQRTLKEFLVDRQMDEGRKQVLISFFRFLERCLAKDRFNRSKLILEQLEKRKLLEHVLDFVTDFQSLSSKRTLHEELTVKIFNLFLAMEDSLVASTSPLCQRQQVDTVQILKQCLQLPGRLPDQSIPSCRLSVTDFSSGLPKDFGLTLRNNFPELGVNIESEMDEGGGYDGAFGMHRLFRNGFALINTNGSRSRHFKNVNEISQRMETEFNDLLPVRNLDSCLFAAIRVKELVVKDKHCPKYLKEVGFSRVLTVSRDGNDVDVYLVDVGTFGSVAVDSLRILSSQLRQKKPLLELASVDTLGGRVVEMQVSDACAAFLSRLDGVERSLVQMANDRYWFSLLAMKSCRNLRLLSAKVVRERSRLAHGNNEVSNRVFHTEVCLELCSLLSDDPRCWDAVYALYYIMDMMPESRLQMTFEDGNVDRIIEEVKKHHSSGLEVPDHIVVTKIICFNLDGKWENGRILFEKNRRQVPSFPRFRRHHLHNFKVQSPPVTKHPEQRKCSDVEPPHPNNNENNPRGKYMRKSDIDPRIRWKISTVDAAIRVKGGCPTKADYEFKYHHLIKTKAMEEDVVFVPNLACKSKIEEHIVALLNHDDRVGMLVVGISSKGLVEGVVLTRKYKDLFRQELDDVLKRIRPDPLPYERVDQPVFVKVSQHPNEATVAGEFGDRVAYVIRIDVNKFKRKPEKKIWFQMASARNGFLRLKGETVEATANNVAKFSFQKQ